MPRTKTITINNEYDLVLKEEYLCTSKSYLSGFDTIPNKGGIYFFYDYSGYNEPELVYVGQATNLKRRIRDHYTGVGNSRIFKHSKKTNFIDYNVTVVYEDKKYLRDFYEGYFIDKYQPKFNKQHTEISYYTGGGRPKREISTEHLHAIELLNNNSYSKVEAMTGFSKSTLQRIKKQYLEEQQSL